jgi:hypothetical protein
VRVMKSRKVMVHNTLITDVTQILSPMFKPDLKMIKKRIEDLISARFPSAGPVLRLCSPPPPAGREISSPATRKSPTSTTTWHDRRRRATYRIRRGRGGGDAQHTRARERHNAAQTHCYIDARITAVNCMLGNLQLPASGGLETARARRAVCVRLRLTLQSQPREREVGAQRR